MSTTHAAPGRPARRPSTTKRMVIMLIVVALVFGAIFGVKYAGNRAMNDFFDNMPQPPSAITTAPVQAQRWSGALQAVGTLNAVNGTDVTAEVGGIVQQIAFDAGQTVRKGDLLVNLNNDAETATMRALEAQARLAAQQRQRWVELGQQQLVSRAEVDERISAAASAQAELEAQRARMAQKTVRAPFSGTLGIRRVDLGDFVNPGDAIVTLQSLDPIFLDFTLPEGQLGRVQAGQQVTATIDAMPGQTFEGTVTAIEPAVDAATRNFRVQATLRNPDNVLRPGTFARVSLALGGERNVLVVPQTAVQYAPYGNTIYVVGEAPKPKAGEQAPAAAPGAPAQQGPQLIVNQVVVETGETRGDLVEIRGKDVKAGMQVATTGLLKLRNGASVVVNNSVRPTAQARPEVENR